MSVRQIIVFAKTPVAGKVKMRLAKKYGAGGAAIIARKLLFQTAHMLKTTALEMSLQTVTNIEFCCAPNAAHPAMLTLKRECNQNTAYRSITGKPLFMFTRQLGADLGQRMFQAAKRVLKNNSYVMLIGTDCPELTGDYIESAFTALQKGNQIVIGPARDGGYVLLGLSVADPGLFKGIDWGSSRVLSQTVRACARSGLVTHLLPTLMDIDYPQDWKQWCLTPLL